MRPASHCRIKLASIAQFMLDLATSAVPCIVKFCGYFIQTNMYMYSEGSITYSKEQWLLPSECHDQLLPRGFKS